MLFAVSHLETNHTIEVFEADSESVAQSTAITKHGADNDIRIKRIDFGIELTTRFTGMSDDDRSFEWRITLARNGRKFSTKYSCGLAHCSFVQLDRASVPDALDLTPQLARAIGGLTTAEQQSRRGYVKPTAPTLSGVLHSLQIDCQAGSQSFADYCGDFGADNDSIAALRIVERMRELLGRAIFEEFLQVTYDC